MRKELEILLDCPVCSSKYDPKGLRVVSSRNNALLVHVSCNQCQSHSLAVISKNNNGMAAVSMGMLTDLDYDEACEMLQLPPITADEVLDLHQAINSRQSQ